MVKQFVMISRPIQYGLKLSVSTFVHFKKHHCTLLPVSGIDLMSKSWNEILRHLTVCMVLCETGRPTIDFSLKIFIHYLVPSLWTNPVEFRDQPNLMFSVRL